MKVKKVEKVFCTSWRKTLLQIRRGEMADFIATAEEGNRIRVTACELNKKGEKYSVMISGNNITVMNYK
jgi:hypothetical protein